MVAAVTEEDARGAGVGAGDEGLQVWILQGGYAAWRRAYGRDPDLVENVAGLLPPVGGGGGGGDEGDDEWVDVDDKDKDKDKDQDQDDAPGGKAEEAHSVELRQRVQQ
jgi:hypothetical protein